MSFELCECSCIRLYLNFNFVLVLLGFNELLVFISVEQCFHHILRVSAHSNVAFLKYLLRRGDGS